MAFVGVNSGYGGILMWNSNCKCEAEAKEYVEKQVVGGREVIKY